MFSDLKELQFLNARSNQFTGPLPSSLSQCSMLQVLNLMNNSLEGDINLNFTGTPLLKGLILKYNKFTGYLPTTLSECTRLEAMDLARNDFSGEIPEEFGNLQYLSFLSLSNNSFQNISRALKILQRCQSLTTLILTMNFYNEELPSSIFYIVPKFKSLRVLALPNCGLYGSIPPWLSSLRELQILDLSWNHLCGTIPHWIGALSHLFYLDLSNNSLGGEIPQSLSHLPSLISGPMSTTEPNPIGLPLYYRRNPKANELQYIRVASFPPSLYLSNNKLTGQLSPEIANLIRLHVLDLSRNNFSGTIPDGISNMRNLEQLDLSQNNLSGSIPPSLVRLNFLAQFNVSHNSLQGEIPSENQFSTFAESSFEGNPGLCGTPLPPCRETETPHNGFTSPWCSDGSKLGINNMGLLWTVTCTLLLAGMS
ncbi:hypothetical protein AMTRI_Chr09g13270 [Amborella trichopoda]